MKHVIRHIGVIAVFVLIGINVLLWSVVAYSTRPLSISFLDVGQGDAIFIQSPEGNQMLIDGGRGTDVLRELGEMMAFWDRDIDVVIATHPDADHIGGLPEVLARYEVDYIIHPGRAHDSGVYEEFITRIRHEGAQQFIAQEGMEIRLGEMALFEIVFPDRSVAEVSANAASVVGKLSYGETSVMLSGDAPDEIERYVVSRYGISIDADILKLGHHGSDTSTDPSFLAAVSPTFTVISRGADNHYGHPSSEVVERVRNFGAEIFDTAEDGTVTFESDGEQWSN